MNTQQRGKKNGLKRGKTCELQVDRSTPGRHRRLGGMRMEVNCIAQARQALEHFLSCLFLIRTHAPQLALPLLLAASSPVGV
jgi:hypothetical protein